MDINDKIKKMNELLVEVNALADEINKEHEASTNVPTNIDALSVEYVLSKYINDVYNSYYTKFWLDGYSAVDSGLTEYAPDTLNPYCNYLNEAYAKQAEKIKKFNDLLMAFKWCYDNEYVVDWCDYDEEKYTVFYNVGGHGYEWTKKYVSALPIVYFSSQAIAEECVKWLDHIDPDGKLLVNTYFSD